MVLLLEHLLIIAQIFGTLNAVAGVFAWLLPETKDLSLEQMDVLFGVVDENTRQHDIEKNLHDAKMSKVASPTTQVPE